jgi:DNA-binding NarL/FixJ family response regulator
MSTLHPKLAGLIETLSLLVAQGRAYDRALPPENFHARAAVAAMSSLAEQALNEAYDLAEEDQMAPSTMLSPRELEVLCLVSQGLTNKEIAYRLRLSPRTIQYHLNSIFNKTGVSTRSEAVAYAYQNHWL